MNYLIYSTHKKALDALDEIYANAVTAAANDDRFLDADGKPVKREDKGERTDLFDTKDKLYNAKTKQWDDAKSLDKAAKKDKDSYPLLGWKGAGENKRLNKDSGYTTAWAEPQLIDKGIYAGSYAFPDCEGDARFSDKTGIEDPQAVVDAEYEDLFNVEDVGT